MYKMKKEIRAFKRKAFNQNRCEHFLKKLCNDDDDYDTNEFYGKMIVNNLRTASLSVVGFSLFLTVWTTTLLNSLKK
jgi:hypothetical protein